MFTLENISKIYTSRRGSVKALDDVSLSIAQGEFVTITGASGSGKTTLLLALGGLIHPTSGVLRFRDSDLSGLPPKALADYRNRKVGFVLQTFNLIPYLTASENVMLPMALNRDRNGASESRAEELLDRVGLKDRKLHLPRELSVGQQQRVAIARALANDPEVLLADEPTGNLDPGLAHEILQILKNLNESGGHAVIMVTHSPEAAGYGGRRLRLSDGKLLRD